MNVNSRYWCVVPAAGVGKRMGAARPKQYLVLGEKTLCEHTLTRLLQVPQLTSVIVCISPQDEYWPSLAIKNHPAIETVNGGKERCDSVLKGLAALQGRAQDDDWVLVHDAARPCVRVDDISQLIDVAATRQQGAILAVPVRDTLKRAGGAGQVQETVDRTGLWHALTPQLFRYGELQQALQQALQQGVQVTDEASAIEWAGGSVALVEGHPDNIKITHPNDLALAKLFLEQAL